jgi:hypothetical protein
MWELFYFCPQNANIFAHFSLWIIESYKEQKKRRQKTDQQKAAQFQINQLIN